MILKKVKNEVGATAIEYGLIASLVAVVAVTGMSAVGGNLSNTYCTISKHLGGSGECSGGSSKGTGGISTGSENTTTVNGENSPVTPFVMTKDIMDNLKKSLVDDFDDSFLDSSLGGTNGFSNNPLISDYSKTFLSNMTDYNKNNPDDKITNVFGLYDGLTQQPITSWAKASQALNSALHNDENYLIGKNNYGRNIEFTTQKGHVYSISGFTNTMTEKPMKGS